MIESFNIEHAMLDEYKQFTSLTIDQAIDNYVQIANQLWNNKSIIIFLIIVFYRLFYLF